MRTRGIVASSVVAAFAVAGLAAPAATSAAPAPDQGTRTPTASPVGLNQTRITFNPAFLRALGASGESLAFTGPVTADGTSRTFSVGRQGPEGYQLAGTLTMRSNSSAPRTCRIVTVATLTGTINCVRGDGTSYVLFRLVGDQTSRTGRTITQTATVRIASTALARWLDRRLSTHAFTRNPVVGTLDTLRRTPLTYQRDSRTDCEIDNWASDLSINRGWALQTLVNRLPQDVTVSRWVDGELVTPDAPQTNLGQRTPKMEGITTRASKVIESGSQYWSDHYWEGYNYGCNTNAPFVVAPGDVNKATTWNYNGIVRTSANNGGGRPQWWAQPRQTNRDSPIGRYSWTCRSTPSGSSQKDTWWARVDGGSGFFGDSSADKVKVNAGSAPACQDAVLSDMVVTTKYAITKRGNLEGRNNSGWPRGCEAQSSDSVVGCWEEIYSLRSSDSWDRAWAYQYHVYASALRAELQSDLQIKVPATYDPDSVGYQGSVRWRIVGATVSGAWPRFTDADGTAWDMSGVAKTYAQQNFATASPYTVPGDNSVYTLSGYGTPEGDQAMTFSLVADSVFNPDTGTWGWPIKQDESKKVMPRPQIKITLRSTISNFDDGGTCNNQVDYDDFPSGATDTTGGHCLQCTVPTLWPLPANADNNWKRVHDQLVPDPANPQNKIPNKPNTSLASTVVKSCFNSSQITVQDLSEPTAPDVGADYTWPIKITGTIDSFSSC